MLGVRPKLSKDLESAKPREMQGKSKNGYNCGGKRLKIRNFGQTEWLIDSKIKG
jgi:hypothetical protein